MEDTTHTSAAERAERDRGQTNQRDIDRLFRPLRLSDDLTLTNHVIMAPMTRSMADDDLVPTADMAAYYARRAGAGLIITEGTLVAPGGQGYPNTPGIYSDAQIEGWQRVTRAVHRNGGRIFLQLWHTGRVSHPIYLDGALPVAPSAVPLRGRVPRTDRLEYGTPRALRTEEVPELVDQFARGARNALAAGFDGVEIHGANGYLIDQFLHHHTNNRTDAYGGTPERMARFALDVVRAVVEEVGSGRVGLRLSPGAYMNMEGHPDDAEVFRYLLRELRTFGLAYVHAGVFDDSQAFSELNGTVSEFLREHYDGVVIGNGGYTPREAARAIERGAFDAVAIGRAFIANPDLIAKLASGQPLQPYEPSLLASLN